MGIYANINFKEVSEVRNRIKNLRIANNISQAELGNKVKASNQAISAYESGFRNPKPETWQALADYFNVSIAYLKGAYSKDEILKMLQEAYKKAPHYGANSYYQVRNEISFNVDLVMIAHGFIEPNEPSINGMLSQSDVNNFEFWKQNFSFIFESVAIAWLISRPIEVSDDEILKAINEAIQIELSKLATDTRERQDKDGYWLESPSKYLSKRQEFINDHITQDGTLEF
ncbi:helix-turn-helix domain-containing protein [Lactobacillus johnsonii]|uniref:helix-turn-helix domain-containing protein n=1 Tax=Lactobacillus johnsonii TaxID=33959 RepID=UPI0021C4C784|nr:helix-turn-helix transcriptional regulator [Lactobacillus johnsonii]